MITNPLIMYNFNMKTDAFSSQDIISDAEVALQMVKQLIMAVEMNLGSDTQITVDGNINNFLVRVDFDTADSDAEFDALYRYADSRNHIRYVNKDKQNRRKPTSIQYFTITVK